MELKGVKGSSYVPATMYNEAFPALVNAGLVFIKDITDKKGYIGDIIEPLAIDGLDSLFCKDVGSTDRVLYRLEKEMHKDSRRFEDLVRYLLLRYHNKAVRCCPLLQALDDNEYKEYVLCGTDIRPEDNQNKELLEKVVYKQNYKKYVIMNKIGEWLDL